MNFIIGYFIAAIIASLMFTGFSFFFIEKEVLLSFEFAIYLSAQVTFQLWLGRFLARQLKGYH